MSAHPYTLHPRVRRGLALLEAQNRAGKGSDDELEKLKAKYEKALRTIANLRKQIADGAKDEDDVDGGVDASIAHALAFAPPGANKSKLAARMKAAHFIAKVAPQTMSDSEPLRTELGTGKVVGRGWGPQ